MLRFFKKGKDISQKIAELQEDVNLLKKQNDEMFNRITLVSVYGAMGLPFVEGLDERIKLLIEARRRGYFDNNNHFMSLDDSGGYFKHHYSNIASNYGYYVEDKSLYIPVIGVGDNFYAGRVCIYKDGVWALIIKNKNESVYSYTITK